VIFKETVGPSCPARSSLTFTDFPTPIFFGVRKVMCPSWKDTGKTSIFPKPNIYLYCTLKISKLSPRVQCNHKVGCGAHIPKIFIPSCVEGELPDVLILVFAEKSESDRAIRPPPESELSGSRLESAPAIWPTPQSPQGFPDSE